MTLAFFDGFRLSLGLIAAIGAQNAFVLRQGVRREHVLAVCLFCALSDAALIAAGVAGFGALAGTWPAFGAALRWGGVAFLVWYGAKAFRAAWTGGQALRPSGEAHGSLSAVLGALALITWLNPHVWLDTVVLVGSVAAQYPGRAVPFGLGAAAASAVFFFSLGFGARLLAPLFARPRAWQALDAAIGVIMWSIAAGLALG